MKNPGSVAPHSHMQPKRQDPARFPHAAICLGTRRVFRSSAWKAGDDPAESHKITGLLDEEGVSLRKWDAEISTGTADPDFPASDAAGIFVVCKGDFE